MPGAIIAIDQDRPGPSTSVGSNGVARKDLWQNRIIRPRSTQSGNDSQQWTLLDKPAGSTASLSNDTATQCFFTPDLPGSYRVQLVTNEGGAGNVQVLIAAVTFDTDGALLWNGWRVPAFGEKMPENNFSGQVRGWAEAVEQIFRDIASFLTFDTVSSKLVIKVAEMINSATANGQANTKETQLRTTDNASRILTTLSLPTGTMVLHEVEVLCIKSDATVGGYFKKSRAHLRATGGGVTSGTTRHVDKQFLGGTPLWDITLDEDGAGNARVNVNSQGDDVTWYVVRQGLRIAPAS
jgi:hypothetical protein